MILNLRLAIATLLVAGLALPSVSVAQFAEGFDSAAANVKINPGPDTVFSFVDYGNLTRGAQNFMIPEAPRPVAGSAATRGLILEANVTAGAATGINVLAGMVPVSFSGNYRLSYDVWLNENNMPFPANGTTENLLFGVGTDDVPPLELLSGATGAIGVFGGLNNENGGGTEDARVDENDTELLDLGDTQGPSAIWPNGENEPFDAAFPCNADGTPSTPDPNAPNGAPMNDWVQVDIDVHDLGNGMSNVGVYFNFVRFFDVEVMTSSVTGFAMLGYEDRFNSLNSDPDGTFGLFDNFTVTLNPTGVPMGTIPTPTNCTLIPEPGTGLVLLIGMAFSTLLRRRK